MRPIARHSPDEALARPRLLALQRRRPTERSGAASLPAPSPHTMLRTPCSVFSSSLAPAPSQARIRQAPGRGRISKMGNRNLRKLLVVGAHAVLFHRKPHTDPLRMWAKKLIEKKPFNLVAVALANKMARIAFAILRGKTVYREIPA
jgi:hypothetical protein